MSHDPEYLHQRESIDVHKRHRRRRCFRSLFTVFFVLISIWVLLLLLAIGQLLAAGVDLRDAVGRASKQAEALAFDQAQTEIYRAAQSLSDLERAFSFLKLVWIFPGLEDEFSNLNGVFISSGQLIDSLSSIFELGEDVMQLAGLGETALSGIQNGLSSDITFNDLSRSTKRTILQRLSTVSDDFSLLSSRIRIANDELGLMRKNRLVAPFLSALDPFIKRMETVDEQLRIASVFANLMPELSGLDGDRTHLLLFLNNDELRPGGGFIGTYGLLRVKDGEVISIATKDVYALNSAVASKVTTKSPEPLAAYNATPTWFSRDANWSPDFSVSAEQMITLFEQESALLKDHPDVPSSTRVDSVIGFTPAVASALLKQLGPIQAGGQTFTSQNVPELIEYQVERGFQENGVPYSQRKEILAELVAQIQERLMDLPFGEWTDFFSIISEQITSKQLAIYLRNEGVQQVLDNAGWTGSIAPETPDAQLFVDANLASLKSDPVVKRSLRYELFRNESGTWIGRTTVTYDHQGSFDWRTTRYRTHVRLYVPSGTTLIRTQGMKEGPRIERDLGMDVFSGFVVIEPGEEQSIVFEYRLSDAVTQSIKDKEYQLSYFKQFGARDYALTLDLDFDKNITHANPPENRNEWGDDQYRLNTKLSQNKRIDIGL
jgi:hypothetical protein